MPRSEQRSRTGLPALVVTVDGPAGAGKTTAARNLARALHLPLIDTGAIYRTFALAAQRTGIAWDDEPGLRALSQDFEIEFTDGGIVAAQRVLFRGEDVTQSIRTPEISSGASQVSAVQAVRDALLGLQRALARRGGVAEGRDMGTVVFPHAPYKFFLDADLETRATRRYEEMRAQAGGAPSEPLESVVEAIRTRDTRDSMRAAAPLSCPDGAIRVDTSQMSTDQVVTFMLGQVRAGGWGAG